MTEGKQVHALQLYGAVTRHGQRPVADRQHRQLRTLVGKRTNCLDLNSRLPSPHYQMLVGTVEAFLFVRR